MITESQIRAALRLPRAELREPGPRGSGRLVVIVRHGTAEFYAVWHRDGRRKMAKIGTYPALGLADARRAFNQKFAPAISGGTDPSGDRTRRARQGVTVGDLFRGYVDTLTRRGAASTAKISTMLLGPDGTAGISAQIGSDRRAADVAASDLIPILSRIHARGATAMARETRVAIGSAFAWALRSANDYRDPGAGTDWGITANPVLAIPADTEARRAGQRYLSPAEFKAFWDWLSSAETTSGAAPALRVAMATGQRLSEITRISVGRYDAAERLVDWDTTKNGRPHTIPLPRQAWEILDGLTPNCHGLYFQGADPRVSVSVSAIDKLVNRYLRVSGADKFTARDIRRTWKTLTGQSGIAKEIRDRIQHHGAGGGVSAVHYDRWDYMPEKRAAMTQWSEFLDRVLAGDL